MARSRLCKFCRGWHDPENWPHNCMEHERPMQILNAPMLIADGMRAVQSMTNGQMYDSKSALRAEYKRAGVIEVGNEKQSKPTSQVKSEENREARRASIGKALSAAGFGAP